MRKKRAIIPFDFKISDEAIDTQASKEYFQLHTQLDNLSFSSSEALAALSLLERQSCPIAVQREVLVRLGETEDISIYSRLNQLQEIISKELLQWLTITRQKVKLNIENSLLGEKKVLLPCGLGGKDNMPRFFVGLFSQRGNPFSPLEEKIIRSHFSSSHVSGMKVEEITISLRYISITMLHQLSDPPFPTETISHFIEDINPFLCHKIANRFVLTSARVPSNNELDKIYSRLE